jgi:hypothetical protein
MSAPGGLFLAEGDFRRLLRGLLQRGAEATNWWHHMHLTLPHVPPTTNTHVRLFPISSRALWDIYCVVCVVHVGWEGIRGMLEKVELGSIMARWGILWRFQCLKDCEVLAVIPHRKRDTNQPKSFCLIVGMCPQDTHIHLWNPDLWTQYP